jgi:hypothetical protein
VLKAWAKVSSTWLPFLGAARITHHSRTADGKFPSGVKLSASNPVILIAEQENYNDHKQRIYLTANIEYLQGQQQNYSDTDVSLLSVTNCAQQFEYKPQTGMK